MSISSLSLNTLQRPSLAEMRDKMFQKADTDGNGSISKDELKAMMAQAPKHPEGIQNTESADDLFAKIDSDGNGEISKAENDSFMEAREKERTAQFGGPPEAGFARSFTGSSDIMKTLMEALKQSEGDSDSTDASSGVEGSDKRAANEKLIAAMLEQLRQLDSQYSDNGVTRTSSSANLFSTKV